MASLFVRLSVLLLCSLASWGANAAAEGSTFRDIYVDPQGSTASTCGTDLLPCASLELALSLVSSPSRLLLKPGLTYGVPPTGLNLAGLTLSIQPTGTSPAATRPTIDCQKGPCLSAVCQSAACASASLDLGAVRVIRGASDTDGGCLSVVGQSVSISGAVFSGCVATATGGAVSISSARSAVLTDVLMTQSSVSSAAGGGGCLALHTVAAATLTGVNATQCYANTSKGGAISVDSSAVSFLGGFVTRSVARLTGGCLALASSTTTIQGTHFEGCQAASGGCLADLSSPVLNVTAASFKSCHAAILLPEYEGDLAYGGCLLLDGTADHRMAASYLGHCVSQQDGGGMYHQTSGSSILTGTTIEFCVSQTQGGGGGGAIATYTASLSLSHCIIRSNSVTSKNPFGGGLYILDSVLTIEGTNFTGNRVDISESGNGLGGAMYMVRNDPSPTGENPFTLTDCWLEDNMADEGGAVYAGGFNATIQNCHFLNNHAGAGRGGALVLLTLSGVFDSSFTNNSASTSGGALYVSDIGSGNIDIQRCNFSSNAALTSDGGALDIQPTFSANATLTSCNFLNNSAQQANGGAAVVGSPSTTFLNCHFLDNWAFLKGGALIAQGQDYIAYSSAAQRPATGFTTALASEFRGNRAEIGGGAIYVTLQGQFTATQCTFSGNSAASGGAFMGETFGYLTVDSCSCTANTAKAGGGCVSAGDVSQVMLSNVKMVGNKGGSEGGAIRVTAAASLTATQCYLTHNSATEGGAMWAEMDSISVFKDSHFISNNASLLGGALYLIHTASCQLEDCQLISNKARHGGAITSDGNAVLTVDNSTFTSNSVHAVQLQGSTLSTIRNSTFEQNSAGADNGGAVLASDSSQLKLRKTNFFANVADRGAALYSDGQSVVTVNGSVFIGNKGSQGGGLFAGGSSRLVASGCTFEDNGATQTGAGAVYADGSTGELVDSTFLNNTATEGGAAVYIQRGGVPTGSGSLSLLSSSTSSSSSSSSSSPSLDGFTEASVSPLHVSGLTFSGTVGPVSQGAAYMDASYAPSSRSNCSDCHSAQRGDSIGSLPASFRMMWQGSNDTSFATPFRVKGDMLNPISGLQIYILDPQSRLATEDFSAVVSIAPSPEISGLLRATALKGVTTVPPVNIVTSPLDGSNSVSLSISVSSPVTSFPTITRQLVIEFCPAGEFYDAVTKQCYTCPVGSWCGVGLGAAFCPDGSFSFFPGAQSIDACYTCPDTTDSSGSNAVLCTQGNCTVASGFWMDMDSLSSGTPMVYSCDVLDGCAGFTYVSTNDLQCGTGYGQDRLCSLCDSGYYSVLKTCFACGSTFTNLFPLFVILMVLAWVAMGMLSNAFHTIAIFIIEAQMLSLIGTYNLPFPAWVTQVIEYFQIAIFIPDLIGPSCSMTYNFPARWAVAMIIPIAGVLVYASLYLLFNLWVTIQERYRKNKDPAPATDEEGTPAGGHRRSSSLSSLRDIDTKREMYDKYYNTLVHGCTNWLDLCYAGVTYRCFQAFYEQFYGANVMGASPTIGWFSNTHTVIFALSVVITAVYIVGAPLCYAVVLWWGKKNQQLNDHTFKTRWGWMVNRYEYEYFWWHLTCFARRIILSSIAVFGVHNPDIQLSVTLPLQAVRIGLQYGASPFAAFSHDILNSLLALSEFLFTIGIASYEYLNLPEASQGLFGLSIFLLFAPTLAILLYESLNKYISRSNSRTITNMWQLDKLGKSFKSRDKLNKMTVDELVHPKDIAVWFRPHILYAFLEHASRKESKILLRVRDRFQACRLVGLGRTDWIKHLTKSQLYAVLSQALLGAAVGEVTIARMPVKALAEGQSIEEIQLAGVEGMAAGESRPGTAGSGESGFEDGEEVSWPPKLDRHVSWTGAGGAGEDGAAVEIMGQETERLIISDSVAEEDGYEDGRPPEDWKGPVGDPRALAPQVYTPAESKASGLQAHGAAANGMNGGADAGEGGSPAKAGLPPQGKPLMQRLGSFGSMGGGSPTPSASPLPPRTPPLPPSLLSDSAGGTPTHSIPRGPSLTRNASTRRPPLPPRPSSALVSHAGAVAGGGGGPEYLEARMNMADLTLTFQRHLAMLVRCELNKTGLSLRLLLCSDAVPVLLAWLTSPACTPEDQLLLREMVDVIRAGAQEEAGGLQWYHGLLCFLKTHAFFSSLRPKKSKQAPTLADISSSRPT